MSTFMFKFLNHDLRLLKFNKPLHFFAEMPLARGNGASTNVEPCNGTSHTGDVQCSQ